VPFVLALSDQWKETPPPAVSIGLIVEFLRGLGGGGGARSSSSNKKESQPENIVSALAGVTGVGFSSTPLPVPADPAGLMAKVNKP
jgi:hypothetical protein